MRHVRLLPIIAVASGGAVMAASLTAAAAAPGDLLANGSFEEPALADGSYSLLGAISGWTPTRSGCAIEVQRGVAGAAYDGAQLLELDSHCSGGVQQVVTTEPGLRYAVDYAFSARPGTSFEDNRLLVAWDATVVDQQQRANGTGATAWTTHEKLVVASGATSVLSFRDGATAPGAVDNGVGVYLDAVSLTPRYDVCRIGDAGKAHKAGSTAPIRVQLCDATGENLSGPGHVLHALGVRKIDDSATALVEDSGNANPDDDFRHDPELAGYIFNLSTKGLSAGTWLLRFTVDGGGHVYTLPFDVR